MLKKCSIFICPKFCIRGNLSSTMQAQKSVNKIRVYLSVIILILLILPAMSFSQTNINDSITQYIIDISNDIQHSIQKPDKALLRDSTGEIKLKLYLSPWGELKDAYVSESSGSKKLDEMCLQTVMKHERFQPFPEALGDSDLWIDVPVIFDTSGIAELRGTKRGTYAEETESSGIPKGRPEGLDEAMDIAMENNMAVKIAQEEISLARLKIREARRALFPAASLNYLETIGKTTGTTQDFTDKEYKVKFEYPLYYGWRLKYAVEQAISNMKASVYNHDKVSQDLRLEVETSFYSYLVVKSNVKLQAELLKEVQKIYDIAKKKFDLELTTKAEFFQVQSQLNQVSYQVASSENELAIAELTLQQAMHVEELEELPHFKDSLDADLRILELELGQIDITLEECVDLAFRMRPGLKSKKFMVEFNDYGRKIAISKDQIKVDLTGTYGKSGGAFETETLTLNKDWYFGLKVTKPLGGNTLSASYTRDDTSPKTGVSTRTESITKALELGLLDNLGGISDEKSASIAFKKAKEELEQTKDTILKEVKESFLNYKKGLIQTKANIGKISYREEELKIAKSRSELNEIPLSELVRAHTNLTDEKSFYIEAVGSLYQALAKLNKSTGYSLFLNDTSFMLASYRSQMSEDR